MNDDIRTRTRRGLVVGYLLAFALPWLVWSTTIAEQRGLIGWHLPQSLAFWVGLPVAYLAGAWADGGTASLRELGARMLRWRTGWAPWAAAVVLGAGLPLAVWAGVAAGGAPATGEPLSSVPAALGIEIALFWLTEEAMWRGFALPRLERLLAPGPASVVVGAAWALWHLPLFAIAGSFQSGLPFWGFALLTVATSVILGWLFRRSGGSVPVCAWFHGVVDVTFATTGVLSSAAGFWTVVGLHVVVAGVLWWRDGLGSPVRAEATA